MLSKEFASTPRFTGELPIVQIQLIFCVPMKHILLQLLYGMENYQEGVGSEADLIKAVGAPVLCPGWQECGTSE